jgi:hypothetical protein
MDLKDIALGALREAFHPCGVKGCTKRSIGFSCHRCGSKICQRHHYLTPPDPADPVPRTVCIECIVAEREHEQAFVVERK